MKRRTAFLATIASIPLIGPVLAGIATKQPRPSLPTGDGDLDRVRTSLFPDDILAYDRKGTPIRKHDYVRVCYSEEEPTVAKVCSSQYLPLKPTTNEPGYWIEIDEGTGPQGMMSYLLEVLDPYDVYVHENGLIETPKLDNWKGKEFHLHKESNAFWDKHSHRALIALASLFLIGCASTGTTDDPVFGPHDPDPLSEPGMKESVDWYEKSALAGAGLALLRTVKFNMNFETERACIQATLFGYGPKVCLGLAKPEKTPYSPPPPPTEGAKLVNEQEEQFHY